MNYLTSGTSTLLCVMCWCCDLGLPACAHSLWESRETEARVSN